MRARAAQLGQVEARRLNSCTIGSRSRSAAWTCPNWSRVAITVFMQVDGLVPSTGSEPPRFDFVHPRSWSLIRRRKRRYVCAGPSSSTVTFSEANDAASPALPGCDAQGGWSAGRPVAGCRSRFGACGDCRSADTRAARRVVRFLRCRSRRMPIRHRGCAGAVRSCRWSAAGRGVSSSA